MPLLLFHLVVAVFPQTNVGFRARKSGIRIYVQRGERVMD